MALLRSGTPHPARRGALSSGARRCLAGTALGLALLMPMSAVHATESRADLATEKSDIDTRVDELMTEFEGLDEDLARVVAELEDANEQLPDAEDALDEAQQELQDAIEEEEELSARLTSAENAEDDLEETISDDEDAIAESEDAVTTIGLQAYKNSGITSDVALLLQMATEENGADGLVRVDSAVRSQQRTLTTLSEQRTVNENNLLRLDAVSGEVSDLQSEAAAAVLTKEAAEQAAQDRKDELDELILTKDEASQTIEDNRDAVALELEEQQAEQDRLLQEIEDWEEEHGESLPDVGQGSGSDGDGVLASPVSGYPITSDFGYRIHPISGTRRLHNGTDYGVPCGTPMKAPGDGTVVSAGWAGGYGYRVVIAHGTIGGHSIQSTLNHNQSVEVSAGQTVAQGDLVAYSGTTGSSTGCHQHFEIIEDGTYVDPVPYIS
ncbi:peptidoglycan DD-metalloendopeptidase family protein [Brevibacterium litoralis]|uniref:peptidoglycan DD-metalloendopeptidase family protein n=1 Tax=Brevibacterium litoralis TaxID=3138935 RepID=UPI0032EBF8D7